MSAPDMLAEIPGFISDFNARKGTHFTWDSPNFGVMPPSHYPPSLMLSEHAVTPVPSTRSITSSSAISGSTRLSSCFDRPYYTRTNTNTAASSISTTTAAAPPPRRGPTPPLRQRPALPTACPLVCEFIGYDGCDAVFDPDDEERWVAHVAGRHLRNIFPLVCGCWFCDDAEFEAASGSHADREACYRGRMRHIAWHFRNGWSVDQMRPDFFFLDHVHDYGLITEDMFQRATRFHEIPQIPNLHHAGWRRPERPVPVEVEVEVSRSRPRRARPARTSQRHH
ncbi:hypothetical protein ACJ41O_008421 [Fusarium nematophilum]